MNGEVVISFVEGVPIQMTITKDDKSEDITDITDIRRFMRGLVEQKLKEPKESYINVADIDDREGVPKDPKDPKDDEDKSEDDLTWSSEELTNVAKTPGTPDQSPKREPSFDVKKLKEVTGASKAYASKAFSRTLPKSKYTEAEIKEEVDTLIKNVGTKVPKITQKNVKSPGKPKEKKSVVKPCPMKIRKGARKGKNCGKEVFKYGKCPRHWQIWHKANPFLDYPGQYS